MKDLTEKQLDGLHEGNVKMEEGVIEDLSMDHRKVLWKLDFCLLPLLAICYMLQFLDKGALGYAAILGIITDTNLKGTDYSWTNSIFYFGYFFMSYPSSFLNLRLPIGKYLACTVILWGGILMAHAGCHNFAQLMVVRFLLGALEASVAPGFSLITGMFYKREEQPLRHGIWFLGNSLAATVGGLLSWAIGHIRGDLETWRYIFLILGAVTSAWGVAMLFLLPDSPMNAWFLTKEERLAAVDRVKANRTAVTDWKFKSHQMWEAFRDPQLWLLCLNMLGSMIVNSGLIAFSSLIIQGFGWKGLSALLMQMPSGGVQFVLVFLSSVCASYVQNARTIMLTAFCLIALLGSVLVYALSDSHRVGKLIGVYLMGAFACNIPISMSLVSSNIAGATKKSTAGAMLFASYCLGNIISPQAFLTREAPKYPTGFKVCIAGLAVSTAASVGLRFYLIYQNRLRKQNMSGNQDVQMGDDGHAMGSEDLTDKEMKDYIYVI